MTGHGPETEGNPINVVDLTLPIESGMAGIPKIAFCEKYPVKVEAVTIVNEAQRPLLER